ncbi:hypothetical protein AVEN_82682-1 [Araneus ventricosus]|uniref:Uncharacterized protein n=1 Tax=Araneus ventricosus TaxID=182803 RepID=A0A4Y2WZY3_ARAVE|nr:hypothetical protein AVEN_245139-1 [Araneus ventricosus]GBO41487.1 hypothetical protein AVEN_82682-1 [Araneus ventricosus]
MRSDTSSNDASDSSKFYETESTPQARRKTTFKNFLKDKAKPKKSVETLQDVQPMDQESGSSRRKRTAGKKGKPHPQKLRKGQPTGQPATAKPTVPLPAFGGVAVPPQYWKTVPTIYAPNTPDTGQKQRPEFQGEVPDTPDTLLVPVAPISCQQELRAILADFDISEELTMRLTSLMTKVDLILAQNVRFQTDLAAQVRSLQESVSSIQARMAGSQTAPPPTFADRVSGLKPVFAPTPLPITLEPVAGPSREVEPKWTVVTSKRKAPIVPVSVQKKNQRWSSHLSLFRRSGLFDSSPDLHYLQW